MLCLPHMRALSLCVILLGATLAHSQSKPNAVRLTKYILGVADLDRTYAFYHALGLDLENGGTLNKPSTLPDMLLKLVDVPAGTKFRNMMLKIPNAPFLLEVTEFSNMDLHPVKPRISDAGASLLVLDVADADAARSAAKNAGAEVVTAGGPAAAGAVTLRDPDGYYVELAPRKDPAAGGAKIVASFGSVVENAEKAAHFYQEQFGFTATTTGLSEEMASSLGTPGARVHTVNIMIPGKTATWSFIEFKGVDRKSQTPRIPDPGAAAVGLQVSSIDAAIAAIKVEHGKSITQGGTIQLGPNGKVGFVRDPSGVLVELAQP